MVTLNSNSCDNLKTYGWEERENLHSLGKLTVEKFVQLIITNTVARTTAQKSEQIYFINIKQGEGGMGEPKLLK